jgi:hypothetical protein
VSVCDEPHLRSALSGGGTTFITCSGTITLTSPIQISAGTSIRSNLNAIISGGGTTRVFVINAGTSVYLSHVRIESGHSDSEGGAILNNGTLIAYLATIRLNSALSGGAIANHGTLFLFTSNISANAADRGGGLANYGFAFLANDCICTNQAYGAVEETADQHGMGGGGIYNSGNLFVNKSVVGRNFVGDLSGETPKTGNGVGILNDFNATLNVAQTLFSSNDSTGWSLEPGPANLLFPGAIANFGGNATVSSSTFSQDDPGAISNVNLLGQNGAVLTVTNSTFFRTRLSAGPIIYNRNRTGSGSATAFSDYNTFVNRTGPGVAALDGGDDPESFIRTADSLLLGDSPLCRGNVLDFRNNIAQDGSCNFPFSLKNTTVQVGSLAYNGGPTPTIEVFSGGPAADKIPPGVNRCGTTVTTDQRGAPRPQNGACDIGAFEAGPVAPPPGAPCDGSFSGESVGDLFVNPDTSCTFFGGSITGNIHLNGGKLALSNVTVNGNIEATAGALSIGSSTNILGNLEIHDLSGNIPISICGADIRGHVEIHNNASTIMLGSDPLNFVSSPVPAEFCEGSTITGDLHVHNNSAPVQIFDNTVEGTVHVHNNSGPIQAVDNVVGGTFYCHSNSAIIGGPNVGSLNASGQCYVAPSP